MCRRGENIYKRKDGRWEGRCIVGRRGNCPVFKSVYAYSYMKVRELLTLEKANIASDAYPKELHTKFSDWVHYWLREMVAPNVKSSTLENYRRVTAKHLLPAFGHLELKEITKEHIDRFLDTCQQTLAPSTVRSVCRIFKGILLKAQAKGLCANPFADVRLQGRVKRPRILTLDEQRRLERNAQGEMQPAILLGLYTGLRVGELCSLRWEDFDWDEKTLLVRRTVQRIRQANGKSLLVIGTPKSVSAARELPIPEQVFELLQSAFGGRKRSGYVFCGRRKEQPMEPRTMQARLSKLTGTANLRGVHMHTLRHTYATRCLEQGIGIEILSELLGHSSMQITMNYYVHCTDEAKRKSVNRLRLLA